ncbi:MAG: hypothetical protein CFH06_00072 [Alphaproteobacteria bacterium MarineAlpha3_Bin5]|nr:hypothetical protein [Magnetovibrio sp.]PPR80127.1 MAG: hypothetical protein CFH06_00072 [Alphaproteobacteria bacterium MarineAlpha3_Bin5]|tara:strand:+ start:535 stop:1284 length:750 start_codon:yes stop_codon:yes gene_type:complete
MKIVFMLFLFGVLLHGEKTASEELGESTEYRKCIELAESKPQIGLERAKSWMDLGGGVVANYCAAISLLNMGLEQDAALNLENVAERLYDHENFKRKVLIQAGHAWLLAKDYKRAFSIFSNALKLYPGDASILLDRAYARGMVNDYSGAVLDLNFSIAIKPSEPLGYVLRGTAYRYLDKMILARKDIEKALELDPNFVEALLERGILKRLSNDKDGARRDWVRAIELAPDSESAAVARQNLVIMDLRVE